MGEFNSASVPISSSGLAAAIETKRTGLSFKEYQELKSSVHRDLISRVDLERVANQGAATDAQLVATCHQSARTSR